MMLNVWHLKVSSFPQFVYFPIFIIFFLNCADIAEDSIIKKKNHLVRTNFQTSKWFKLHGSTTILNEFMRIN